MEWLGPGMMTLSATGRTVECPTCGAKPGAPCTALDGRPRQNHTKRNDGIREEWWRAREAHAASQQVERESRFAARLEAEKSKHSDIRRLFHRAHLSGKEIRIKTGCCWESIFAALGVGDYEGYQKAMAARNTKRRQEIGWPKIRAAIIERDGRACVVTGEQAKLEVHHVNGDYEDNRPDNLATLTKRVHSAIENPIPLGWWHRRAKDAEERLNFYWRFAEWVRQRGHPRAGVVPDLRGALWFRLTDGYVPGDQDDGVWKAWEARRTAYLSHKAEEDAFFDSMEDDDGGWVHEERFASFDPSVGRTNLSEGAEILSTCPTCGASDGEPCTNLAYRS